MEQYQYQPLPTPTSMRLIRFKEGDGSDEFFGNVVVTDTKDPPEYTALSYVWGDPKSTVPVPVQVDGQAIQVSRNLKEALQQINPAKDALIWADALCINQHDISERNQQVNIMSTIYRKATCVMVWLGPDEYDDADAVFLDIKALTELCWIILLAGGLFKHFDEETGDLSWELENQQSMVSALPGAIVDPDEDEKARLQRFFRLPWFSRTWVVQEVGLAAKALLLWGDLAIQWAPVGLTAMFLVRYCGALVRRLRLTVEIQRVFHIYTAFSPFIPSASFFHVISNVRRGHATDPRDKVFALLSHPTAHTFEPTTISLNWNAYKSAVPLAYHLCLKHGDQFILKNLANIRATSYTPSELPPPLLKADYEKTTDEVYRNLALDHIHKTKSLEILTAVQHDPEDPSALFNPSWVPRWDYFIDTPIMGLYNSDFFASANRDVILTPSPSDIQNALTVRGKLFSRIIMHTDLIDSSSFDLPSPTDVVEPEDFSILEALWETNPIAKIWFSFLEDADAECYPVLPIMTTIDNHALFNSPARNIYNAFIRTWVTGKDKENDSFDLKADSAVYWERLFHGPHGSPQTLFSRKDLEQSNRGEWARKEREDKTRWQRYRDSAAVVCHKRKFFFTKKGFFGLGPGALQEEDFVAILLGADVPFIIRELTDPGEGSLAEREVENKPVPMDRKFRLIGECYVDGLMCGEGVRSGNVVRDITLI